MDKKNIILITFLFLFPALLSAQTKTDRAFIQKQEDSLRLLGDKMINALDGSDRQAAAMQFIPHLVNVLKTPYSFAYPFDSIKEISIVYPPDSTFRIFTWGVTVNNATFRFYGALQMNTPDGSLKLFPFFDNSAFINNTDTITGSKAWYGALYYNILSNTYRGRTYYTLFGWHGYHFRTNEKLLEILTFKDGRPVFGAPVFNFQDDSIRGGIKNRFFLTYKRDGNAGLNYDAEKKMIIYDHLISLNGRPEEKYTLVPDGTYDGFVWKNGYWVHVSKVYHTISEEPPIPAPVDFKKNILEKAKPDSGRP